MLNEAENAHRRQSEKATNIKWLEIPRHWQDSAKVVHSTREVRSQFLEFSPVGIPVTSSDGTINSVNEKLLKLSGHTAFDLIHQNL